MKTYWAAFLMRAKMEAQYRAAALSGLATQLFFGLILVYLYRALYGAGADLAALASTATYVWIQQAFFRMVCADDNTLTAAIIKGDMAYQLVRPVDQYNFWFARNLAMKLVGALMRAFPLLLIAALLPAGVGLSAPASFGALMLSLLSLLLGLVAVTALSNISAGLVLVTLDNRGINAVITFLILFLCGNILPLTLFPDRWQRFIQWQPFAQILDAPIRLYTGKYALRGFPQIALMQVFWIVLLVLIGRMLWRHTLRRIVIQGG